MKTDYSYQLWNYHSGFPSKIKSFQSSCTNLKQVAEEVVKAELLGLYDDEDLMVVAFNEKVRFHVHISLDEQGNIEANAEKVKD